MKEKTKRKTTKKDYMILMLLAPGFEDDTQAQCLEAGAALGTRGAFRLPPIKGEEHRLGAQGKDHLAKLPHTATPISKIGVERMK